MKKINLNDVDVRSILEMHQKEGYKSSLLNEQGAQVASAYQAYQQMVDPAAAAVKAGTDQLQKQQQTQKKPTNVVGKESYTIMSNKYTLASYTKGDNKDGLNLFKGVKFVKSKNGNYLVTQSTLVQLSQRNTGDDKGTANAVVMYNCSTAQFTLGQVKNDKGADSFYLKEKGRSWFDESKTLTNQLKSVCQYKGGTQTNNGQTKPGQSKVNATKYNHVMLNKSGQKYTIPAGAKYVVDRPNNQVNIGTNFAFTCKPEFLTISFTKGVAAVRGVAGKAYPSYFIGKTGKDRWIEFGKDPGPLATMMKKAFCSGDVLKADQQINTAELEKEQKPNVGGGNNPSQQTSSQTSSQTQTINKQIQQLLGTQEPTGQITDAELDAILAKLR